MNFHLKSSVARQGIFYAPSEMRSHRLCNGEKADGENKNDYPELYQ